VHKPPGMLLGDPDRGLEPAEHVAAQKTCLQNNGLVRAAITTTILKPINLVFLTSIQVELARQALLIG
jgi:hypothetical protein